MHLEVCDHEVLLVLSPMMQATGFGTVHTGVWLHLMFTFAYFEGPLPNHCSTKFTTAGLWTTLRSLGHGTNFFVGFHVDEYSKRANQIYWWFYGWGTSRCVSGNLHSYSSQGDVIIEEADKVADCAHLVYGSTCC